MSGQPMINRVFGSVSRYRRQPEPYAAFVITSTMLVILCFIFLYDLLVIASNWGQYTNPWVMVLLWTVVVATAGLCYTWLPRDGTAMPTAKFATIFGLIYGVAAAESGFLARSHDYLHLNVVGSAAAFVVILFANYRPAPDILLLTAVLALNAALTQLLTGERNDEWIPGAVLVTMYASQPGIVSAFVVAKYLEISRLRLRFIEEAKVRQEEAEVATFGAFHTNERIRELSERIIPLLRDVAQGEQLPLRADQADLARELSLELRQNLIAERNTSWLNVALATAPYAGRVAINDPSAELDLLNDVQRANVLELISLLNSLVSDADIKEIAVHIDVIRSTGIRPAAQYIELGINAQVKTGSRLAPGIWSAMQRLGDYNMRTASDKVTISLSVPLDESWRIAVSRQALGIPGETGA